MSVRVRVLPRETAAAVITGAVSAVGWAVAMGVVVMTVPVLVETLSVRGHLDVAPLALLLLGVVAAGVLLVAVRPRRSTVFVYLVVAGAATVGYEVLLLSTDPGIVALSPYLVNRPTLALALVGIPATRAVVGIGWSVLGFVVATLVGALAFRIADVPFNPGWGPTMVLVLSVVAYLTLAAIQSRLRRRVPNFDELEAETEALAHGEDLARRTTAVVHDTLLNDLALVLNAPDRLDDRARERLRSDLETLRGQDWISRSGLSTEATTEDAELRNELTRMASEYQWQGVGIHVTGGRTGEHVLGPEVAAALLAAVRASLENVVRHSGATTAEIEVISDEQHVTVMVTDQGVGFDPESVPPDRLGLRASVSDRMTAVGGSVRIWSAPGQGTSVIISAPVTEAAR